MCQCYVVVVSNPLMLHDIVMVKHKFLLVNEQVEAYRGKDTRCWQLLSKRRRNSRVAVCSQEAKAAGRRTGA